MQILDYFHAGGFIMWLLLACSVLSVGVILERLWCLRRSTLLDKRILDNVQEHIENKDLPGAVKKYRESKVLLGRILSHGLEQYASTKTDIETSLFEAGNRGLQVLHRRLSILNVIAKVAPLLGLLGTVLGMILGFEVLEQDGVSKAKLAGAIRVALLTTAAGLFVAIPTVVAAAYFRSRIRGLQSEFEEIFIDVINSVKKAGSPKMDEPAPRTENPLS